MEEKLISILDLGTTKTVCLIGQQQPDGKIKILGFGEETSAGIHRGLVMNVNEASRVINTVVEKAQTVAGVKISEVYVGIAGQHISTQHTSHSITNKSNKDFITQELLDRLLKEVYQISLSPGEKVLHVFPQEYFVDNLRVTNPVGTMGGQLKGNFNIAIIKEKNIDILAKAFEFTNLKVKNLILEPVASSLAVLSDDEKEAGVCMIDIGGGTTDLIIYKDNIVRHLAVIPAAGQVMTKDIQTGLNVTEAKAERLKVEYGSAIEDFVKNTDFVTIEGIGGRGNREISLKAIAGILQTRVHEIIDTALNEIKNSGLISQLGAGITITGGGSMLKNLSQFVAFRSGFDTKITGPNVSFINTNFDLKSPKYSTAVGLLMRALEIEKELERKRKLNPQQNQINQNQNLNQQNNQQSSQQNKQESNPNSNPNLEKGKKKINQWMNGLKTIFGSDTKDTDL